jgi:ribosome-associated heat shock protein Hsp15
MIATIRIDKWLWAARFFKTRSLASDALQNGKVRLDDERVKASRNVRIGDVITIDNGATEMVVTVLGLSDVRAAAPVAQALYAETAQSVIKRKIDAEQKKIFREPALELKGRLTKRDRRVWDKLQP